ncbi:MAG: hypothetical protein CMP67_04075 [Flavobacteriales bacterium]|nr:hypothetical protein [Flavobacteriales bacterium]MBO72715.1 hypothetical protein [Flavobacteriales bacterium]|tara:strand:+ start:45 stop:1073 length:1029 start_codon:yes stop_codon:yes gene_type:complete
MSKEISTPDEGYFDSSNLYVFLYKYKLHLGVLLILSSVISIIVSLNIQEKFKSTASIYPSNTSSLAKALISTRFGGKTDIMEFGEEEKSEQLLEILNSDKVKSKVIKKFNLLSHYGINPEETETPNHDLQKLFDENISFKQNKNMAVEITVLDHSPDTASLIAKSIINILDDVVNAIQKERAIQGFEIVKKTYGVLSQDIRKMEDSLAYIMSMGVLDIKSQSEVYGDAYAQAVAKGNTTAVKALEEKLAVLSKYGAQYMSLRERLENERLRLSELKGKYEEAKVDAESRIKNYFVVRDPLPAEKKSYPIRWLIVVLSVMGTILMGIISIFFYEQAQKVKAQL